MQRAMRLNYAIGGARLPSCMGSQKCHTGVQLTAKAANFIFLSLSAATSHRCLKPRPAQVSFEFLGFRNRTGTFLPFLDFGLTDLPPRLVLEDPHPSTRSLP